MKEINIGANIAAYRREKGVTQEELANYIGVSKPAVSKWESGQSYPDILLLPILASYFNISVDQLIGYEPQMSKEDIRKLCAKLKDKFAKEPFDQVLAECEEYLKKYYSCWELQFQIACLLVNHSNLTGTQEGITRILERALEIFKRVESSSQEVSLAKLSIHMQAACYLGLQQPQACIDILETQAEPMVRAETLIVNAYQMMGDNAKAMEYLQGYSYVNLIFLLDSAKYYFLLCNNQPEKIDLYYHLFLQLCDLFEMEELHPVALINIYLLAARSYTLLGNKEKALDILEAYTNLVLKLEKSNFTLHGNRIFDMLDHYFETMDLDTASPRGVVFIWKDLRSTVLKDPAYGVLEEEERYIRLKKRLELE
jgi:transcriptional regulator with XRE-family HTH domain